MSFNQFYIYIFILVCSAVSFVDGLQIGMSARQTLSHLAASTKGAVRVSTYNVLSSHLASPDYFRNCEPQYLDQVYRLSKVKEKLDMETSNKAVICLQEISTMWAGALHVYFASKGYSFTTALYGKKFNGYMGVGMAVPMDKYDIIDCDIQCIGDTKKVIRDPKPKGVNAWLKKGADILRKLKVMKRPEENPWQLAARRANQMICLKLRDKSSSGSGGDDSFVVGTYHMPCMFRTPQVMMIHCALSAQHIHKFASGAPYVYCGDFNIKPDSPMYDMMTRGKISNPQVPENPALIQAPGDKWESVPPVPLTSAYHESLGREPDFTNHAQVLNDAPFIDTLDYIFLGTPEGARRTWKVENVLNIPHRDLVKGPYPAEEEPSDHVMLSANLELVKDNQ